MFNTYLMNQRKQHKGDKTLAISEKETKGITLIALIITIIVLLIIARNNNK